MQRWYSCADLGSGCVTCGNQIWIHRRCAELPWNDCRIWSEVWLLCEYVCHGRGIRITEIEVVDAHQVFDGAQDVDRVVVRRNRNAALAVGRDNVSKGAMRVDVIRTVLGVVLKGKDGRIAPVRGAADNVCHATDGAVVVRDLELRASQPCNSRPEAAVVIVGQRKTRNV